MQCTAARICARSLTAALPSRRCRRGGVAARWRGGRRGGQGHQTYDATFSRLSRVGRGSETPMPALSYVEPGGPGPTLHPMYAAMCK